MKKKLLEFKVIRHSSGMKIQAKSKDLEEFFKTISNGQTSEGTFMEGANEPARLYTIPSELDIPGCSFDSPRGKFLDTSNRVNLTFLRRVGLGEGVEFMVKAVHSRQGLSRAAEVINEGIKTLYAEYVEPIEINISISQKESAAAV